MLLSIFKIIVINAVKKNYCYKKSFKKEKMEKEKNQNNNKKK